MAEPYNSEEDENGVAHVQMEGFESDGNDAVAEFEDDEELPRVSHSGIINVEEEEERNKRRRVNNNEEIEGLFCPICMEYWTSEGDHHICCLPCGHLFGWSCICKWSKQDRSKAKCPQCNRKFTLKDVRKLFAPRLAVVDEESQKTICSLEIKRAALEKKDADWCRKESEWKKREADLQLKINQLTGRATFLEHLLGESQSRSTMLASAGRSYQEHLLTGNINSSLCSQVSSSIFVLERELPVNGARLFDINEFGQVLLIARRLPKSGLHVLTKMNLLPPHEHEDIFLPSSIKIIKDLHISPFNRNHALCASLGKKLCVLSMENNSVILSYDLPAPAWSCSWNLDNSYYIYAGLQNGSVLAYDIRQTGREVESRLGLTSNPIHTLRSFQDNSSSGARTLLSASSIGICQWNFGSSEERPFLIHETANKGVCISLACCSSTGDIVATYRPRVEMSNEILNSQPPLTPSPVIGQTVSGFHLHLKRMDDKYQESGTASTTISNIRLPKSVIVDVDNQNPLFATGDEVTCGLILQELPSFTYAQRLNLHKHPICDVKYNKTLSPGLLGCLSEDMVQLFKSKQT